MKIIDLDRTFRAGKWCMLVGAMICVIAVIMMFTSAFTNRDLIGDASLTARATLSALALFNLLLGLTLILMGNFFFRRHDDDQPPRSRGQA